MNISFNRMPSLSNPALTCEPHRRSGSSSHHSGIVDETLTTLYHQLQVQQRLVGQHPQTLSDQLKLIQELVETIQAVSALRTCLPLYHS